MPITRRRFMKIGLVSIAGTFMGSVGGYAYARDVEPSWVEIVPVTLQLPRLHASFDGYRIAQISDIHMGTGMTGERLARIVDMINQQQPDLVALTGDYVTLRPRQSILTALREGISALTAPDGVVAVLGNHDNWSAPVPIRRMLNESGVIEVSNDVYTLRRSDAMLHIAGVDSWWEHLDRLDLVLKKLPADGTAILLAHEPDYADISAESGRFDLQISGHSHGGQVVVPAIGPIILPRLGRKYPIGLYTVGAMWQYTNRGVGTVIPAVRFNCRPEITMFTLQSA